MIDFSPIPAGVKPVSPWRDVLIAVGIAFVMLGYMAFYSLVINTDDPTNGADSATIILDLGVMGFIVWLVVTMFQKLGRQKRLLMKFAQTNGFRFEEPSKRTFADPVYNPPGSKLVSSHVFMRYRIAGETASDAFELYGLWGGTRSSFFQRSTLEFMTVLRIAHPLVSAKTEHVTVETRDAYGYVSIRENAFTRELMQEMFTAAGLY